MDRSWVVGQHERVISELISHVRALVSPISGLGSSVSVLRHTRLESPITGLISVLSWLISALTLLISPLITPICWPTTQRLSKYPLLGDPIQPLILGRLNLGLTYDLPTVMHFKLPGRRPCK